MQRASRPRCVAIVSSNFWPERTGTSQTVGEFAKFFADHGVQVRVATALPYYPEWRIWDDYRGRLWRTDHQHGTTVFRTWHFVSPTPSTLTRLLHELTLSVLGALRIVQAMWRADWVYVVSPDLAFAFTGMWLGLIGRRRRVLVVKDVMPDAAIELGMLRNRLAIAVARWMARCLYRWADEIHTLGEGMRQRIAREVGSVDKIRIVRDTIDAAELAPVPYEVNDFRRRFVPAGTFAVLHTGNMGTKQDLELLLRAAGRLRDDAGVRFYVFGDGAAKERFLQLRDGWRLDNVSHHPLQDRSMLRHMLSGADVVLVSQLPEVVDIVVPSKLLTALGAGAMIVAACAPGSETARLIGESDGGLVIRASDDEALVRVIQQVRSGEVDVAQHRRRAREFAVRRFDRRAVYGPLVQEYLAA